jgi:hypothetical protein
MKLKNARLLLKANKSYSIQKRLSQKSCQPELVEGNRFDCQYFDKLNMTIKTAFETASFYLKFAFITRNTFSPNIFLIDFRL